MRCNINRTHTKHTDIVKRVIFADMTTKIDDVVTRRRGVGGGSAGQCLTLTCKQVSKVQYLAKRVHELQLSIVVGY